MTESEDNVGHSRSARRILFVDDEAAIVRMATRMLPGLGYDVCGIEDSGEGLALFRDTPNDFDLIIVDFEMALTTGLDFARACKKIRPEIPIILSTGYLSPKFDPAVAAELVDAILLKPYRKEELRTAIRTSLGWAKETPMPSFDGLPSPQSRPATE